MTRFTLETVQAYYDERIEGKLRDFTHANPRIEAAVQTLAEWAPPDPKRILEIGCGIGATAWRMARVWPDAQIVGVDLSPASIEVAKTCFHRPNLTYRAGLIKEGALTGAFDLVLLMDTYEHIAMEDRSSLHSAIKSFLSEESRIVITVPTPAILNRARTYSPSELQPVDEDIDLDDICRLAEETGTKLLYYRELGIWRYGDYAHAVLGRFQVLTDVAVRQVRSGGIVGLIQRVKSLVGADQTEHSGRCDYLGSDVLSPFRRNLAGRFNVTATERKRLASLWLQKSDERQIRSVRVEARN